MARRNIATTTEWLQMTRWERRKRALMFLYWRLVWVFIRLFHIKVNQGTKGAN
jgi:hypothetical protein